jgi:hypothetical protein
VEFRICSPIAKLPLLLIGRLLRGLDDLGRAAADTVEAKTSSVDVVRFRRLFPPPPSLRLKAQDAAKTKKGMLEV